LPTLVVLYATNGKGLLEMPQLDAVTFLSQVSWLTFFFVGYYRIGLTFILPSLAGRLKARGKKVLLAKGRVSGFDGERVSALSVYDNVVGASSAWVAGHLIASQTARESWRQEQVRAADAGVLEAANRAYLVGLSTLLATQAVKTPSDKLAVSAVKAGSNAKQPWE